MPDLMHPAFGDRFEFPAQVADQWGIQFLPIPGLLVDQYQHFGMIFENFGNVLLLVSGQ